MNCPECNSTNTHKNSIKRGKQNHICYDCRRQFVIHNEKSPGYSKEIKKDCLFGWVLGDPSAETFRSLWALVSIWQYYF